MKHEYKNAFHCVDCFDKSAKEIQKCMNHPQPPRIICSAKELEMIKKYAPQWVKKDHKSITTKEE